MYYILQKCLEYLQPAITFHFWIVTRIPFDLIWLFNILVYHNEYNERG